jgi:hypothetical protein
MPLPICGLGRAVGLCGDEHVIGKDLESDPSNL